MKDREMTSDKQIVLELAHASVVKSDRRILDDLNLVIREGEHTAIVGPNGAGKSTLMKLLTLHNYALINRDGPPAVRVFGRDRWNVFELRSLLGIVSSDLHHSFVQGNEMGRIDGHTAVVSGFFASQGLFFHQDVSDEMNQRATAALARLRPNGWPAGEARRVLIARALVVEPRALVLDEPTTGLDIVARHEFMQLVRSIAREGTTVIIVTHHIDEIIPEIERVVLLQQGRLTHNGPKSQILTSENLSQTFGAPISLQSAHGYYSVRLEYGNDPTSND
jgi:iron complex transport system ATP-binding protein